MKILFYCLQYFYVCVCAYVCFTFSHISQPKKLDSGPLSFLMDWLVDHVTSFFQRMWAASGQKSFSREFKSSACFIHLKCSNVGKKLPKLMVNYGATVTEIRFGYRVLSLFLPRLVSLLCWFKNRSEYSSQTYKQMLQLH